MNLHSTGPAQDFWALLTDDERPTVRAPLDIEAEIAHYGADTRGGVGVSTPALA